ncbi:MAG: hypothetical protein U1F35_22720 [Steroidobacteraceae bacterium]
MHHEISGEDGIAVVEDQDIVYRDHPRAGEAPPAPVAAPSTCDWSRDLQVEPTLLFRYSALTPNGHRIHYDRPYATGEEGYPGLVVHGPLLATLLLELLRVHRPEALVREFTFRLAKPTLRHHALHAMRRDGRGAEGRQSLGPARRWRASR